MITSCCLPGEVGLVYLGLDSGLGNVYLCFFQAEDGIRYLVRSRGLGDVYKRQAAEREVCWPQGRAARPLASGE